ncbi:MAG: cyclophilin-like fold protein [Candidatus Methanomethylophilaceae archaeon]|jgi:hypothetical protein
MSKILIKTRNGSFTGELDQSDISNAIWLSLPFAADINMLGSEIFFEYPVDCDKKGEQITKMKTGDIAYWPKASAMCLFFGPTPLSDDGGEPVSPYPVIKIGKLTGDFSDLEYTGDRMKITIEKIF